MSDLLVGNRYVVPYRRLFPIWRFGPLYDLLEARVIGEGWSTDWYGQWEFSSLEEAKARRKP